MPMNKRGNSIMSQSEPPQSSQLMDSFFSSNQKHNIILKNLKNKSETRGNYNFKMFDNGGHSDAITALLPLPKLQFLASAGLDSRIILWDTIKMQKKREYSGFHKKGVISLLFNERLIILISGGIDHNIFIWNPYIGQSNSTQEDLSEQTDFTIIPKIYS